MSSTTISCGGGGKKRLVGKSENLPLSRAGCREISTSLNLLASLGLVQACKGIALPLTYCRKAGSMSFFYKARMIVFTIVLSGVFIDQNCCKSPKVMNLYSLQNVLLEIDVNAPKKTNYRSYKVCTLMRI
jgi:hypothetical protein